MSHQSSDIILVLAAGALALGSSNIWLGKESFWVVTLAAVGLVILLYLRTREKVQLRAPVEAPAAE